MMLNDDNIKSEPKSVQEGYYYYKYREAEWRIYNLVGLEVILGNCVRAIFSHGDDLYQSIYIPKGRRNQGLMTGYVKNTKLPFITAPDCNIEGWLQKRNVPYLMVGN